MSYSIEVDYHNTVLDLEIETEDTEALLGDRVIGYGVTSSEIKVKNGKGELVKLNPKVADKLDQDIQNILDKEYEREAEQDWERMRDEAEESRRYYGR